MGNERLALCFKETQTGEDSAHLRILVMNGVELDGPDGASGRRRRNSIDAVQAGDFLDEIDLVFKVEAEGRNTERAGLRGTRVAAHGSGLASGDFQFQLAKVAVNLFRRKV